VSGRIWPIEESITSVGIEPANSRFQAVVQDKEEPLGSVSYRSSAEQYDRPQGHEEQSFLTANSPFISVMTWYTGCLRLVINF
jgi:hypothetical protein